MTGRYLHRLWELSSNMILMPIKRTKLPSVWGHIWKAGGSNCSRSPGESAGDPEITYILQLWLFYQHIFDNYLNIITHITDRSPDLWQYKLRNGEEHKKQPTPSSANSNNDYLGQQFSKFLSKTWSVESKCLCASLQPSRTLSILISFSVETWWFSMTLQISGWPWIVIGWPID